MFTTDLQILKQPTSNVLCGYREEVILSVSAVGYGPMSYEWTKDGESISHSASAELTGINTDTLTISSFSSGHRGKYTCTVKNDYKSVKSVPTDLALSKTD